jgi:hypothetical protein
LSRTLILLAAAAILGAAPLAAHAQSSPSPATAVGRAIDFDEPATVTFLEAEPVPRPDTLVRTPLLLTEQRVAGVLRNGPILEEGEVPQVSMRPKEEWFADEGFRLGDKRLAYKRRF